MATILERAEETMKLVRPLDRLATVKSRILAVIITSGFAFVGCLCIVGIVRPETDDVRMSIALAIFCSILVMVVGAISYVRIWKSQLATTHARSVRGESTEREVEHEIRIRCQMATRRALSKIFQEAAAGGKLSPVSKDLYDKSISDQMIKKVCDDVCDEVLI